MTVYATLDLEEISATLRATASRCDYGVPNSPTWVELEDMAVESVSILGVDVDPKALPKALLGAICECADDYLDVNDWEGIE